MWRSPRTLVRAKQYIAYEVHRVAGIWTFPSERYSPLGCLSQDCVMFGLLPLELMSTFLPKWSHPDSQSRRGGKLYPKSGVRKCYVPGVWGQMGYTLQPLKLLGDLASTYLWPELVALDTFLVHVISAHKEAISLDTRNIWAFLKCIFPVP